MARNDMQNMERLRTVRALPRKDDALFTNTLRILYAVLAHTQFTTNFFAKKIAVFIIKVTGENTDTVKTKLNDVGLSGFGCCCREAEKGYAFSSFFTSD